MKVYNKQSKLPINEELVTIIGDIRNAKKFDAKRYLEDKSNILNEYMRKSKLDTCVVAISGGIDSAIVLGIINYAHNKADSPIRKIVPLLLPILKSTGVTNQINATDRGKELCEKLNLKPYVIDLTSINDQIRKSLEPVLEINGEDWAIGQLGPYSRTPILYYATSLLNQAGFRPIVCGTTNRSEGTYLGYIGKASDGMVDVQVISDIYKSEVYKVAQELEIPESIIGIAPNGDMYDNRTDEEVFGTSYDFVELYLEHLNTTKSKQEEMLCNLSEEALKQFKFYATNLENLHKYNSHKYISKSPAVHLDLWDSSVSEGWENYYKITQEWLLNK